jgi:hypothetical protein
MGETTAMPHSLGNGLRLTLDSGGGQRSLPKGKKDDDQIARLVDLIGNEQFSIRVAATKELIELGEPAVPALLSALREGLWFTRECAAQALGRIGGAESIEPLLGRLEDENIGVRRSAVQALSMLVERDGPAQVGVVIAGLEPRFAASVLEAIRRSNPLTGRRLDEYLGRHRDDHQNKEARAEPEGHEPSGKDATLFQANGGFGSLWKRLRQYLQSRS